MKTRLSLLSLLLIVFAMTAFAYTAQFHTGPGLVAGESGSDFSRTEPSGDGQGLNLPNAPVLTGCSGWEFAGWMVRNTPYEATDELTQELYRAGTVYKLSSVSEEFYAVYRYKTDRYCEINVNDQLITGAQYIIVNDVDFTGTIRYHGRDYSYSINYPVIHPEEDGILGISIKDAYTTWNEGYVDINSSNVLSDEEKGAILYVLTETNSTSHYWSFYNNPTHYYLSFNPLCGIENYTAAADCRLERTDWSKFALIGVQTGLNIGFYEDPLNYRNFHENFFIFRQQTIFTSNPDCSTPNYTVKFNPGTYGTCATASMTETGYHRGVVLPAAELNTGGTDCDALWEFAGWTESGSALATDVSELPVRLWLQGEVYYPERNETLHAVYRRKSTNWEQVEDLNTLQAGEKILIAYNNNGTYYVLSSAQSTEGYNASVATPSGEMSSLDDAALVWILEGTKGAWRLKDNNNKHLDMTRSDYAYSYTYPWSRWNDEFTISGEINFSIRSNYADKHYLTANATKFLSQTAAQSNIHIFRQVTTYSKIPRCANYTVKFNSGEGTFNGNNVKNETISVTGVSSTDGIVLDAAHGVPVAHAPTCEEWKFAGWRVGSGLNATTDAPGLLYKSGDTFVPLQDNIVLYAVYQNGDGEEYYEKVNSSSEVTSGGTYVIVSTSNNKPVVFAGNYGKWSDKNTPAVTTSNNIITSNVTNAMQWTYNGSYFYNETDDQSHRLSNNGTVDQAGILTYTNSAFRLQYNVTEGWIFQTTTTYYLQWRTSNPNKNSFCYNSDTNNRDFYIYKQKTTVEEYNSWPHCSEFTVVLNSCGGKFSSVGDTRNLKEATGHAGEGVSLRDNEPTNSCGWSFVGWVEKRPIQARNSEPVGLISKTATYHPKQDMDQLYAVYSSGTLWSSYPACGSGIEVVEWATDSIVIESYALSGTPTLNGKSGGANTDGTYYFKYDVISNPCTPLLIEWGSVKQIIKTPLLVTNYTRTSAVTSAVADCSTCDMVVLNGGTAIADDGTEIHDLTVYPGGRFNLASGKSFTASSLTMRTVGDNLAPVALIQGTFTCEKLNHDRRIDTTRYYWMALPYDVTIANINYADATANGKNAAYDTDYYLKFYDGVARAKENGSRSTYWTHIGDIPNPVDETYQTKTTLKAGRGYLIGLPKTAQKTTGHKYRTFRFPMTVNDSWSSEKTITKVVVAKGANCEEGFVQHRGWNMIGNPFLQNYSAVSPTGLAVGKLTEHIENGQWVSPWYELESGTTDVPYVSVYDPSTDTYTQTKVKGQNIAPFSAAFIQIEGDITGLQFQGTAMSVNSAPARRMGLLNEEQTSEIEIGTMGYFGSEQFTLILDDQYSADYEVGADLLKMCNAGKNNLYTHHNGTECVFDALSYADADSIPVGLKLPAATALTIGARRKQLSDDIEHVWLIDNETNSWTDLLYDTYTFTSESGTFNNRLWIRIVNRYDTPTEIPCGASVNGDATYKFIQNGQLYIQRDSKLYNALGAEVK